MNPEAADLQQQVARFVRAFGLHQPDTTACGQPVSTSEAHALGVIAERGTVRHGELAEILMLEKSTVSRLVDHLERRRWISVSPDPADGRARRITLTAAGARASGRLSAARARKFGDIMKAIPARRRAQVVAAVAELARAAQVSREDVRESA